MTQAQNQFIQTAEKGYLDLRLNPNTIPCAVHSSQSTPLVPGQAVKIFDDAGGVIKVIAVAADTDKIFGIVTSSIKDSSYPAGQPVEIAAENNVIYMEASAAIARGAKVMYVVSGEKVATATNGKSCVGFAFDKATASGQFIRIYLQPFSSAAIAGQASDVGVILPTVNMTALVITAATISASTATAVTPSAPTIAEVNTAIDAESTKVIASLALKADNADVETLRTEAEARMDAIETKIDGYRTALRAAGLMA